MDDDQRDDGFMDHVWAIDQRLPDARENLTKDINRRAAEHAASVAGLPDPSPDIAIAWPSDEERERRYREAPRHHYRRNDDGTITQID